MASKQDSSDAEMGWFARQYAKVRFPIELGGFILLLVFAFFFNRIFIVIPAGHQGVLFRPFQGGTRLEHLYDEGLRIIPPWQTMNVYEVRLQQRTETFAVLTKGGVQVEIEISMRYRPISAQLPELHRDVGPEYFKRVVEPEVRSVLVRLAGEYTAEEIYSTKRAAMQQLLTTGRPELSEKGLDLDDLLIIRVELPPLVRHAIQLKVQQEQRALEYQYRLQREEAEAKRKQIEAIGIREFQDIIEDGISERLLRWKGIEATLALAESNNAKVVVIGAGDGLPLILDTASSELPSPSSDAKHAASDGDQSTPGVNQPPMREPSRLKEPSRVMPPVEVRKE